MESVLSLTLWYLLPIDQCTAVTCTEAVVAMQAQTYLCEGWTNIT